MLYRPRLDATQPQLLCLRSAVSDVTSTILPRPAMLPAQAAPPQTLPLRSVCPARVQRHPLAIAAQISALSADRRDFESPATSQRSRSTSSQTPSSSPDRSLQVAENATSSANDRLHAERRRCARPRCCGSPVRRDPGHREPHSVAWIVAIVDMAVEAGTTVVPGTSSDEHPPVEPVRPIVAVGRAAIRSIVVIAIGARRRNSDTDRNLGWCRSRSSKKHGAH
jgi:hypothetical protein